MPVELAVSPGSGPALVVRTGAFGLPAAGPWERGGLALRELLSSVARG